MVTRHVELTGTPRIVTASAGKALPWIPPPAVFAKSVHA